jgi:hypothetical protein
MYYIIYLVKYYIIYYIYLNIIYLVKLQAAILGTLFRSGAEPM